MRRSLAAVATTLALTTTVLAAGAAEGAPGPASAADDPVPLGAGTGHPRGLPQLPAQASPSARQALEHAADVLDEVPDDTVRAGAASREASLALRDLDLALPRLTGAERQRARTLLARPHYSTRRTGRDCSRWICLHWARRTADAPPGRRWVRTNLRVLKAVWRKEVGGLGYRRPLRDGRRGGNAKFDVYLEDVGSQGLYGYCAPDGPSGTRVKRSYCVLDNDFARSQFGARPIKSLKATAAHEFFHAVQFAYDAGEDAWFMEATATWMEERVYDGINDNRQYLPYGQVGKPRGSLDWFNSSGFSQYGNWAFFEYLSRRFGVRVVKHAWQQAGEYPRAGQTYSIDAVKRVLPRRTSFRRVYARFVAANTTPGRSYPEGDRWPSPRMGDTARLGRGDRASGTLRADHLAAYDVRLVPRRGLDTRRWQLRATVDGPARRTSPMAAVVVVRKDGSVSRRLIGLDRAGRGHLRVRFNRKQVRRVYFAAVNASTRYTCDVDGNYSCHGRPLDEGQGFDVDLKVVPRR